MFSEIFNRNEKRSKVYYRSIYFGSNKSNDELVKMIKAKGLNEFLEDVCPEYVTHADCCAFTKTRDMFYLFPIHKDELDNVGLDEQDLLYWIKKLNEMEVGFQYLYFGEMETPEETLAHKAYDWMSTHLQKLSSTKFYWVGVPKLGYKNENKPYLHWVALRYLISTQTSNNNDGIVGKAIPRNQRLMYYHIPRATVMFHEKFGLPFLKAFLYAHITSPYYSGNSLAYSDYMGVKDRGYDYSDSAQAPCVNLTEEQFKALWEIGSDNLNTLLTQREYKMVLSFRKAIVDAGIKHLAAPYDYEKVFSLFFNGEYQEFINEIENSYKVYERKSLTV